MALCPDIGPYLDGEPPDTERRAVEAHLAVCAACRAELRVLQRLNEILREAPPPPRGRAPAAGEVRLPRARGAAPLRWGHRWTGAAAGLLLVAGAFWAGRATSPPAPRDGSSAAADLARDAALAARVHGLLAEFAAAAPDRRRAIARSLSEAGDAALPHIVHALDSPALALQASAVEVLGCLRSARVREILLDYAERRGLLARDPGPEDLLADPPSADRVVTLLEARDLPREIVLAELRRVYRRFQLAPRELEALRRVGYTRAAPLPPDARALVDALRERLRAPDLARRSDAIVYARSLRAEPLVPDLIACLGADGAREEAHAALREITGQDLPADPLAWQAWLSHRAASGR